MGESDLNCPKTRVCTKCNVEKQLSAFHIERKGRYGRKSICKSCINAYVHTYTHSKLGRAQIRAWRQSEAGKLAKKRQRQLEKQRYPERVKARKQVANAVEAGLIPRVTTLRCYVCSDDAREYHHYRGYTEKHWLDVLPVCRSCHRKCDEQQGVMPIEQP